MTTLVLASASPARLQTLRNAGVEPVVIVSGVDESVLDGLPPTELALQLAELKCAAVAERDELPDGALVLGCDSVLDLDGESLGKPGDPEEAVRRWQAMRGRTGGLRTGHCPRLSAAGLLPLVVCRVDTAAAVSTSQTPGDKRPVAVSGRAFLMRRRERRTQAGACTLPGTRAAVVGGCWETDRVLLSEVVAVSRAVSATRSRLAKREAIADVLRRAEPADIEILVTYLGGDLRQRRTGVGWASLRSLPDPAEEPTLELQEVDAEFDRMAGLSGAGSAVLSFTRRLPSST